LEEIGRIEKKRENSQKSKGVQEIAENKKLKGSA
jgi:hypothetical protein